MRIAVIGAGAMGSIISYLLLPDNEVILFESRPERVEEISSNGVRLQGDLQGQAHIPIRSPESGENPFDLIILAVSTVSSAAALRPLSPCVHRSTIYLSMQEGSALDELVDLVGVERAAGCLAGVSAVELENGMVEVEELRSLVFGSRFSGMTDPLSLLAQTIDASGVPYELESDMEMAIWNRIRSAAPVSALCGILGGVPAEIRGLEEVDLLCREAASEWVIDAEAGDILRLATWEEAVWGWVSPPMLRDIEAGRETEIYFLGGQLLKTSAGERPMPVSKAMVSMIVEIQSGRQAPGERAWRELRRRVADEKGMGLS
jgi:2-dehydropantoate 2-reductase